MFVFSIITEVENLFLWGIIFYWLPLNFFIPEEVDSKFSEYLDKLAAKEFEPGDLADFYNYAEKLSLLYGAYDFALFKKIYNRDFPNKKITDEKQLEKLLQKASKMDNLFYISDNLIVKSWIDNEEIIEDLISDRKYFKPYLPTKEELESKTNFVDYDEDLPDFKKFVELLSNFYENKNEAEDATYDLFPYIKLRYPIESIIDILSEDYEIDFSEKQANQFIEIWQNLNNNSHLWSNWGNPPNLISKNQKDEHKFFNDDYFEAKKKAIENRPHIKLPESCVVPTDKELQQKKDAFDAFWKPTDSKGNIWHENGAEKIHRIMPEIKKHSAIFNEFPEDFLPRVFDQWLANLYFTNANREGDFGNQKWNYYVFEPYEKLREDLYVCLLPDGKPIVVHSHGIEMNFEDGIKTILTILIDVGGWYLTYGPVMLWKGLLSHDLEELCLAIAKQTFQDKGLNGVIQFNPVPFWAALKCSTIPLIYHNGKMIVNCIAETKLLNGKLPDFLFTEKDKKEWKHEISKNKKYERYVFNSEDYLGSTAFYIEPKSGSTYLLCHNEGDFNFWLEKFESFFDKKHYSESRRTFAIQTIIEDEKKTSSVVFKLENAFQ